MSTLPEPDPAETEETATRTHRTSITECPDGPLLVRGEFDLIRGDGSVIDNRRTSVALCRCGRTAIAPFCDSSHKKKRRRAEAD